MKKIILYLSKFYTKKLILKIAQVLSIVSAGLLGFGNTWWSQTHNISFYAWTCFLISLLLIIMASPRKLKLTWSWLIFLGLFVSFVITYWQFHDPSPWRDWNMRQSEWWWMNLLSTSFLAALLGIVAQNIKHAIRMVGCFCFVCSFIAIYFSLGTEFFIKNYQQGTAVYNFFENQFINRAGLANLLLPLPVFLAGLVLYKSLKFSAPLLTVKPSLINQICYTAKTWQILLCVFCYFIVLLAAYIHNSRTVFIVLLLIVPSYLFVVYLVFAKNSKVLLGVSSLTYFFAIFFLLLLSYIAINFTLRPVSLDALLDARFTQYYFSFLDQILSDPFKRSSVPIEYNFAWFHNFFADVHRSSGLFAFLLSVLFIFFILLNIFLLAKKVKIAHVFFLLSIVFFLVINTSVVPEGEFQPFLLMVLLGSISTSFPYKGLSIPKR